MLSVCIQRHLFIKSVRLFFCWWWTMNQFYKENHPFETLNMGCKEKYEQPISSSWQLCIYYRFICESNLFQLMFLFIYKLKKHLPLRGNCLNEWFSSPFVWPWSFQLFYVTTYHYLTLFLLSIVCQGATMSYTIVSRSTSKPLSHINSFQLFQPLSQPPSKFQKNWIE